MDLGRPVTGSLLAGVTDVPPESWNALVDEEAHEMEAEIRACRAGLPLRVDEMTDPNRPRGPAGTRLSVM